MYRVYLSVSLSLTLALSQPRDISLRCRLADRQADTHTYRHTQMRRNGRERMCTGVTYIDIDTNLQFATIT